MLADSFAAMAGIKYTHVPYNKAPEAIQDLIGGRVNFICLPEAALLSYIRSGQIKALAVSSAQRTANLPNVPTLSETKPGLVLETWVGISAPPKTPPQIIAKLASLIEQAMKDPELQAQLFAQGVTPVYEKPSEITARMVKEVGMFSALGKLAQISMD
jgi:tripartite-type tricarboxylate transporter receptor subunit TctC